MGRTSSWPNLGDSSDRRTWKQLKVTLSRAYPSKSLQQVLREGGYVFLREFRQSILVVGVRSNLGGGRLCPMFICSVCRKKHRIVWLDYIAERGSCRECAEYRYPSQYRQPNSVILQLKLFMVHFYDTHPDASRRPDESKIEQWRREVAAWL